ncbi:GTP-binding protein [Symbiobacterium terraclitae]|uniref:Probable GTP-binding protein EngB n=1 Tax=Symbiobacterium terraclitae TaxID=557451 RepID=A0ABS4JUE0_9FIRM|nr:GTP-binding protein [Symbiobacterium terraclitae]MBP2019145.1 GTP-binding protein [Symbiobacterium terraclitae]
MAVFAEFVLSVASPAQLPGDGLPELALVGRSNVGKSSLINALVQNRKLARTSNTPGRTQTLNYYRIWPEGKPRFGEAVPRPPGPDRFALTGTAREAALKAGAFYLVDMPGYGFARVSEAQRRQWGQLIENYLLKRETLRGVVQVVDLRHPPSKDDVAMREWLRHHGRTALCVATKADKVGRPLWPRHLKVIAQDLALDPGAEPLIVFSAETGAGREEVWRWIIEKMKQ